MAAESAPGSPAPRHKTEALPRSRIIRHRVIFDATRAKGRRFSNPCMTLNILPCNALERTPAGTVAFLTPKRLGPATTRTQLRRRMREIYRRYLALPQESHYLVWVARPAAVELDFEGLKACMTQLTKKLRRPAP